MIRMAIQVVLVDEAGDRRDVHEIVRIDRGRLCPEALGLSLEEAKAITGGIQQVLAGAQVAEWHADQRACPDCGRRRSLKGRHHIVFRTPFGALRLDSERLRTCPCAKRPAGSMSPLAELLRERVSPEMLYLETKFASLVSYGLTVGLLGELLPLERPIGAERVRRHLFRVAEAHETELASAPTSITLDERPSASNAPPDGPLFVGIDGGYVRGRDKDWFEVIAGKSLVSFHRDGRVPDPSGRCFAFVQTVDDQPRARLVDTLRQQGMQPQQQVVFLSDGADTLRRLQQNIAPEAEHVLDWFHVAMRLTVLGQMIKSARTEAATAEAKAAALERIKWLLWHGNAPDAVDDIECLVDDVTAELEDNPTSASLRKLAAALGEFATYIANNAGHIVNYGERFRAGERISTGFVEFCDQPNRGQALRQTSIDALDTSGCTPAASDPNTRPQQRSRSSHPSLLPRLQEITGHRHCPRFVMGSSISARGTNLSMSIVCVLSIWILSSSSSSTSRYESLATG